ncbi:MULTISPECIES: SDR family NAD(P)-dependent oxidoreductase [unclassified Achromobacter]|uniref:SDR family NAD(P)-dependent oxidoreductase n=1 Tax=unclassified Achromobacter TaxID=2626865 RepID=UPI000B519598|nr:MULTISPECIES: SDR family NAD(P)-dependent oxidoreductase [unclassified Achromobacter]OWT73570.1 short-chain dehydrogenase [Achromobacter sp. HZ34]OWT79513.1 short-chain dehydrogenase [Achromobacter sp. HZ28]
MKLLQDKVAIITGAARRRGIGLATARMFAEHGARVAILDLDAEETRQAAAELGPGHLGLVCDVTNRADCQAAVDEVARRHGGIDILVNNAGITQKRGIMEVSDEDYARVLDTNLRGVLHMSQAVIPHLKARGGGSITCISSLSALQGGGVFGGSHYCAAKAGILGLVRAMALELGPDNIRANGVAPGLILTDFSRGGTSDDYKHDKAKGFPLRRVGQPGDIAGACLYLASELAAYVTGITLDVNGGAYLRP